jgi:hypothetical protein
MKKWVIAALIAAVLLTGARITFAAQEASVKPLEGTIWRCNTNRPDDTEEIWQFVEGGEMNKISRGTLVHIRNEWHQEGVKVTIKVNDGYAIYEGEFDGLSHIKGTARNVKDLKWTFELMHISEPEEIKRYEKVFTGEKIFTGSYGEASEIMVPLQGTLWSSFEIGGVGFLDTPAKDINGKSWREAIFCSSSNGEIYHKGIWRVEGSKIFFQYSGHKNENTTIHTSDGSFKKADTSDCQ